MHEMGIVQGILSTAFEVAEKEGATRITAIRITVGDLTEIMDFALDFAFETLTPGTIAEGATLEMTKIAPRSRCADCDLEFEHDRFETICPQCGSMVVGYVAGRELRIDSIEIDTPEDEADAEEQVAEATGETAAGPAADSE